MERYLRTPVESDLATKMVFVAGPRQVGKTTLARQVLESYEHGVYLTWDRKEDRKEIRAARWPAESPALVVLDELHKWPSWKRWLKGEFDSHRERTRFLVTGSARLDVFRRGGDSLQGRYHHYRLHPLTLAEVERGSEVSIPEPGKPISIGKGDRVSLDRLLRFSGFPEPFLAASDRTHRRWQKDHLERFFQGDVRDLDAVRELAPLELLAAEIPRRVGSPLSVNALREDLEVSHRAVSHWVEVLERLYYLFRVRPYASRSVASVKKMPKAYLWDWTLVEDPAARLENLVALHLLKLVHYLRDHDGHDVELTYLRDRTGREVDFLVLWNRKPWFAVEVKLSDPRPDPALRYFRERLKIPQTFQLVLDLPRNVVEAGSQVVRVKDLLVELF